jgi:peptidoglycan biosynthesis protein MviN/MurJ (putative lipid II flippase)
MDPAEAIAAGRARRAREQRLRISILIVNVVVLVGSLWIDKALGYDYSEGTGIAPLGSMSAGMLTTFVLWYRGRRREGVERLQLLRVTSITLAAVSIYALVTYVRFLVDHDRVAGPGRFLLVIGASLMAANAFADFGMPGGDEE